MSIHNDILSNLKTALDALKTSDDYPAQPKAVVAYAADYQTLLRDKLPAIMFVDQGNDEIVVEDSTNVRFAFDVLLWWYVKGTGWADVQEQLSDGLASLKQFIWSGPSLGDNVLVVQFAGALGNQFDEVSKQGLTGVRMRVVYWCSNTSF